MATDEPFDGQPLVRSDTSDSLESDSTSHNRLNDNDFSERDATERQRSQKPNNRRQPPKVDAASAYIGSSESAHYIRERIRRYADIDAPVLICGETGVGKELVANALHRRSARASAPFIPVNAAAIPESLAASELFGHRKGAFTNAVADRKGSFESAGSGTLFLDEIGDLPKNVQSHLLRTLESREVTPIGTSNPISVKCRMVCATNVDLMASVETGRFRRDLFYRINVLTIDIPPLRERTEDLVEIADALIKANVAAGLPNASLSPNAIEKLQNYGFPGNVRELRNILTRAMVHAKKERITPDEIEFPGVDTTEQTVSSLAEAKKLISEFLVVQALRKSGGNISKAAEIVSGSRNAIYTVLNEYDGVSLIDVDNMLRAKGRALFRTSA